MTFFRFLAITFVQFDLVKYKVPPFFDEFVFHAALLLGKSRMI
jgi:hypothetical protein